MLFFRSFEYIFKAKYGNLEEFTNFLKETLDNLFNM